MTARGECPHPKAGGQRLLPRGASGDERFRYLKLIINTVVGRSGSIRIYRARKTHYIAWQPCGPRSCGSQRFWSIRSIRGAGE